MIVVMSIDAKEQDITAVSQKLLQAGMLYQKAKSGDRVLFNVASEPELVRGLSLESFSRVEQVVTTWATLPLVSRKQGNVNTVVRVEDISIGDGNIRIIAGPCAVESEEQIVQIAHHVKSAGASMLRGGAFKPRTSPYSFQGLGKKGLCFLKKAKELTGMPIVTEVVAIEQLDLVCQYADMLQVGSRNMHNYALLKAVGEQRKTPVLLKRGMSSTIDEWLSAAEYIVSSGNNNVVLCERGIRTFAKKTRYTLDLSAVPVVKARSHLPVIVDPSHATGHWRLVEPMALAAVAAGADGLMIEVHPNPEAALSDGNQSLNPKNFNQLMDKLKKLAQALEKE